MTAAGAQLILEVGGDSWPLQDGDVIGRLGNVGGGCLMKHDVLSRQHLRVNQSPDGWQITLLPEAGNVTRLDGRLLEPGVPRSLSDQCEVSVVGLLLRFRLLAAEKETNPLNAFPVALITLDELLVLRFCNGPAKEMLGGRLSEGGDFASLLDADGRVRLRHALAQLMGEIGSDAIEVSLADGGRWLEMRFRRAGRLFHGFIRDITAERSHRLALRAVEAGFTGMAGALEALLSHPAFVEGDLAVAVPLLLDHAVTLLPGVSASVWKSTPGGHALMASTDRQRPVGTTVPQMRAEDAEGRLVREVATQEGGGREAILLLDRADRAAWEAPQKKLAAVLASLLRQAFANADRAHTLARLREQEQRLASELADAARYIERQLPAKLTKGPVCTDWVYRPCGRLGGDLFGIEPLDEGRLAFFIMDVMGHGSTAALHALSIAQTLRLLLARDTAAGDDPARWLAAANEAFPMESHQGLLWSMWCGLYHPGTRELLFASGGHPPGVLLHGDNHHLLGTEGPVLGAMAKAGFTSGKVMIPAGARLFLFTDGVYEFPTAGGKSGSLEDFTSAVRGVAGMERGECAFLEKRAAALCAEREFPDDFTIVCARFTG